MHNNSRLGAIFSLFILCVFCENAANSNGAKEIIVPSAPRNLVANRVTAEEIHLSWAPPTAATRHKPPPTTTVATFNPETRSTEETINIKPILADEAIGPEKIKEFDYKERYNSDDVKYKDEYSTSDLLSDRIKRSIRSHRHRKRRQENSTETHTEKTLEEHPAFLMPVPVKKSVLPVVPLKDPTQIAYVLYYEQGNMKPRLSGVIGVPNSAEVKSENIFATDLGLESKTTKNLTLLNTSGKLTQVVGFRLRNLKPFTPYKIWVRAFYNFSLDGVQSSELIDRLGPSSEPLYVLTDVKPPSAPIILNLTCDQSKGLMYLQWRQPLEYNNSLDKYVVTLWKLPERQLKTNLTLPTNKNELETTISLNVEHFNVTQYEVKIYAATLSVAQYSVAVAGIESPPEEVSSEQCVAHSEARAPPESVHTTRDSPNVAVLFVVTVALLVACTALLLYWRCRSRVNKCLSAACIYLDEGGEGNARAPLNAYKKPVVNCSPLRSCTNTGNTEPELPSPTATRPPRMLSGNHPAVPASLFPHHVTTLHKDSDIGFGKEYEIVVTKSAALGHTSHYSHRPENRLKNRYLNITAYDHSRVCVSAGGRCGAAGCVGAGRGSACDYVNANFIDGILPTLDQVAIRRIKRKLERRNKPNRQPSVKPAKPPPNLAEGIESAFLNIEFSGIVDSDENNEDSDSDISDDDSELDDVYVDIDGVKTRVKLEWLLWRRRYIATQGPTPATIDAFWKMIWQHRVLTIVMITNLVERGKRKCDMYWPSGGRGSSAEFGGVRVTLLHEDVRAAYTVRHMRLVAVDPTLSSSEPTSPTSENSSPTGRIVVQYHYTVWPDHGTPRHPLAVLPFVQAASQDPSTVLVHCSAGVGRTGTYIVLDAQLNQLKLTGTLSPLGFLCRARTQRNHLVQTEEQYVFVHDALLEHVKSGDTEVEFSKARDYLSKLLQPISDEELAVLDLKDNKTKEESPALTNGNDNGDTASIKSSQNNDEVIVENGSQMSIKTEDLNSEMSKSSIREEDEKRDGMVNGEESEGLYDLAPRATDTYSKKMQEYNSLSAADKEELRRTNRAENYALLERMRSLANKHHTYRGPAPVNLLEKQYLLITASNVESSVCARAPHNAMKNRPDGILPSDSARVMLVPKPGVEGSEYVNASWVCGRRRLREYCVAQHPVGTPCEPSAGAEGGGALLWRLLWDHTAQLVLILSEEETECDVFWPTEEEPELYVANFKASFVSKDIFAAYRKSSRKPPVETPPEPETNGYRNQENNDCSDDEKLIPDNSSPLSDIDTSYRFERSSLRLERLSTGNRDLSTRKSIANGDLFSSFSEKKNGPKSPRSPSKMSLKNFKLSSPTKLKFPEWVSNSKTVGSPPDMAPPPPPVAPSLSVEDETELRRPCYYFEKVEKAEVPSDRLIEVINVSVHSLQDDYQLNVKFIKCNKWLEGNTTDYDAGKPDDNEFVKAIRQAVNESERNEAIDRLIEPYKDSFALIEFVAGCQMEYKNGPVVVVDKYGGCKAMTFCTLSAACGGARNPDVPDPGAPFRPSSDDRASLYCWNALAAHARCDDGRSASSHSSLLAAYCALANYGPLLANGDHR